jgi:hypothetical protein
MLHKIIHARYLLITLLSLAAAGAAAGAVAVVVQVVIEQQLEHLAAVARQNQL